MSKRTKPVEIIRQMNPGKYIPTGAELAKRLRKIERHKKGSIWNANPKEP
jgi:hypothetical protein